MKTIIDITPVVQAVVTLVAVVISAVIIPWIKSKVSASQWKNLTVYAETFVKCAEMIFKGTNLGKDKKKYVLEKLTELCEERGLKFSLDEIEAAVEEAVKNMNDSLAVE